MASQLTTRIRVINGKTTTTSGISQTVNRAAITSLSVQTPDGLARHIRNISKTIVQATAGARSAPWAGGGVVFEATAFTTGVIVLAHNMGRPFKGYQILRKVAALDVYEPTWGASHTYSTGFIVYPTKPGKVMFICSVGGLSGSTEPAWPTAPGSSVTDNAATWVGLPGDPSSLLALQGSASVTADVFIY